MDFGERLGSALSSRVLENLILTGAFDSFGYKRSQLREVIGDFMTLAHQKQKINWPDREIFLTSSALKMMKIPLLLI